MNNILNFFKIGIGPSSSHTVGPMKAAKSCLENLELNKLKSINNIEINLFGSLALTGKGHGTDKAILLGLLGEEPETVITDSIETKLETIKSTQKIKLLNIHEISFSKKDIKFNKLQSFKEHPNTLSISAFNKKGSVIFLHTYFSIGGGFIIKQGDIKNLTKQHPLPYSFSSANQLLSLSKRYNKKIWQLILENEKSILSETSINKQINVIWNTMKDCVQKGLTNSGTLPGGLNVQRRAKHIYNKLIKQKDNHPSSIFDWVSVYALAVNEENAAGGRVVTAPTNGAAGIIPATLHYYEKFYSKLTIQKLKRFFFTAGAIASLYKLNASISGAEMGCQGEIGVASSMAAAGLTELQGGTSTQIECAAEIAMEHHLGLTCDPVKGLVQIPCIERNTMGSIKAINASQLALNSTGNQKVSLDKVIKTMKQTGDDMKKRYKETSKGGLAINVIEC
jgi:L-serine dehydratase